MRSYLLTRFIAGTLVLCVFCSMVFFNAGKWTFNLMQPALLLLSCLFFRNSSIKTGNKETLLLCFVLLFMLARTCAHAYFDGPVTRFTTSLAGTALFLTAASYSAHYFFSFSRRRHILTAALLGGGPVLFGWLAATVVGADWSVNPDSRFGASMFSAAGILAASLLTKSLVLGFGEELFFRGVMLGDFTRVFTPASWKKVLWINGLLFGLWHLPSNVIFYNYDTANMIVNTTLQSLNGVLFACVFVLSGGSILVAGLSHGLSDWLVQDLVSPKGVFLLGLDNISGLVFALGTVIGTIILSILAVKAAHKSIEAK